MEKSHFEQAKLWLESKDKYAVAVSMAIHSIIKANDALTFKFMNITAKRHDDARRLFEDLIKKNFAKAEYRGAFFSKNDFEDMERKAEKFLKVAEEIV